MSADNIEILAVTANFLNTFGYLGVGLLLGAIAWWFHSKGHKAGFWITGSCALTFVLIFGALDIVTRHFPQMIVVRSPIMMGRVQGVPMNHRVDLFAGAELEHRPYLRQANHEIDRSLVNHAFIFDRRIGLPCVTLALTPPDPPGRPDVKAEAMFYSVPVVLPAGHREFEDRLMIRVQTRPAGLPTLTGRWARGEDVLPGNPLTIAPLPADAGGCVQAAAGQPPGRQGWWHDLIVRRALAQTFPGQSLARPLAPEAVAPLMRSDDPSVRRQSRIALGAEGAAAAPALEGLLDSAEYRLRLGALTAINLMPADQRRRLPQAIWTQVETLATHPDPTMQSAARNALTGRP